MCRINVYENFKDGQVASPIELCFCGQPLKEQPSTEATFSNYFGD